VVQQLVLSTVDVMCNIKFVCNMFSSGFGGLVASMQASGSQDRGFEPDQSGQIFRAKKSSACLSSEGK
jgi:hypothetical protein